jgi:hypothetical protein
MILLTLSLYLYGTKAIEPLDLGIFVKKSNILLKKYFQDDFDSTLTGMMGALAEIQRKGDTMLAGIRRQREVLEELERKAEQADRRREQSEVLARQMEDEKQTLEAKVLELKAEKDTLMGDMIEDELEMFRFVKTLVHVLLIMTVSVQSEIRSCPTLVQSFREKIRTDQV